MYKNLVEILNRKKITMKAYAEFLGVSEKTVQNKIHGRSEFTLGEVMKTCSLIAPEYKLDYVFEHEETKTAAEMAADAGQNARAFAAVTA